jgi:hypothetical protein
LEEVLPHPSKQGRQFLVFNYDGEHMLTVTVFVETM